jgi:hypothetical protein
MRSIPSQSSTIPVIAAIAIQKSNRATLARRRISGTSIIPMTTASMIRAASTGLGRLEKSGASTSRVSRTITPEVSDTKAVRTPVWSFSEALNPSCFADHLNHGPAATADDGLAGSYFARLSDKAREAGRR